MQKITRNIEKTNMRSKKIWGTIYCENKFLLSSCFEILDDKTAREEWAYITVHPSIYHLVSFRIIFYIYIYIYIKKIQHANLSIRSLLNIILHKHTVGKHKRMDDGLYEKKRDRENTIFRNSLWKFDLTIHLIPLC